MINFVSNLDELKKEIIGSRFEIDIDRIIKIDIPFIENQEDFAVVNIPSYKTQNDWNILLILKKDVWVCSSLGIGIEKKFEKLRKKKNGESTVMIYSLMKTVLKNYSQEFQRLRDVMNELDLEPVTDSIEETGRGLRKLTDRTEALLQFIIELKEDEVDSFDPSLMSFEYDLLNAEARYWLERCRSHNYRIASLRTKYEMKSNRELNDTMKKLTVIMTFLTIVSIVVNVPGTVGAIFGIPALSEAYFSSHTTMLIITLMITTVLSVLLGFVYWRSLGLKQP